MSAENMDQIAALLKQKSNTKQIVYRTTQDVFREIKQTLKDIESTLKPALAECDPNVEIRYTDKGQFEAELKFSGDTLVFMMHTNVFDFPHDHQIHKTPYAREDGTRSYCGMIQVYNFLSDTIKYSRMNDAGYLIARIFINKERHFFVEGKHQLGFLYNNFEREMIDEADVRAIVERAIMYCLDFDLIAPSFDLVRQITWEQKLEESYSSGLPTSKTMGFQFSTDRPSNTKA